ncbi:MAG: dihydrofolate reductase, partial [Mesorhizobium sp.]
MSKLRVSAFTLSLDGFGAGPDQDLANPLGIGGENLHKWMIGTRFFRKIVMGQDGGTTDTDDAFAARSFENV